MTSMTGVAAGNMFLLSVCVHLHVSCEWRFQVLVKYAGQSFRLLALAVGTLQGVTAAELADMDLQQLEARCQPLDLLALQVLSNRLRPGSRDTITKLQEKYAVLDMQILAVCCICMKTYAVAAPCTASKRMAAITNSSESFRTLDM